jgi:hypothetical protein
LLDAQRDGLYKREYLEDSCRLVAPTAFAGT